MPKHKKPVKLRPFGPLPAAVRIQHTEQRVAHGEARPVAPVLRDGAPIDDPEAGGQLAVFGKPLNRRLLAAISSMSLT